MKYNLKYLLLSYVQRLQLRTNILIIQRFEATIHRIGIAGKIKMLQNTFFAMYRGYFMTNEIPIEIYICPHHPPTTVNVNIN